MTMFPESGSAEQRIRDLERRLSIIERSDRLGQTSYREPGAVRYRLADGTVVLFLGTVNVSGEPVGFGMLISDGDGQRRFSASPSGVFLYGPSGTRGLVVSDNQRTLLSMDGNTRLNIFTGSTDEVLQIRDEAGEVLLEFGDQGVHHPYLPVTLGSRGSVELDGTYRAIASGWVRKYATHLRVDVLALVVAGEQVTARLSTSEDGILATQTLTATGRHSFTVPLNQPWRQRRLVTVEAARTSGSATTNRAFVESAEQSSLLA